MPRIQALDQSTINQIAAGEVVDRPSSIVKELVENAIDAGATAVTIEIKEGGIRYIRITDNGCGIDKEQIPLAFKRHTTSKIRTAEDLLTVSSLGFRGEALSSIAAISQVELITKTRDSVTGVSYCIEGGEEKSMTEIGAPDGTTFLIQNVFYNTPARLKFLKSATTEGNYINELVERMALANPDVAIHFINNGQTKLQTMGNGSLKEVIYIVFGREIAANVVPVHSKGRYFEIDGFLGKPVIARGNRSFENYFINERYIKSNMIAKAIETAYQPYMMQHRYPFVTLHLHINQEMLDVNVHPAKMEVRFKQEQDLFHELVRMLSAALAGREFIPDVELAPSEKKEQRAGSTAEPFEEKRSQLERLQELAALGVGSRGNDRGERKYVSSGNGRLSSGHFPISSGSQTAGRTDSDRGSVTEYHFDFVSGTSEVLKKKVEQPTPIEVRTDAQKQAGITGNAEQAFEGKSSADGENAAGEFGGVNPIEDIDTAEDADSTGVCKKYNCPVRDTDTEEIADRRLDGGISIKENAGKESDLENALFWKKRTNSESREMVSDKMESKNTDVEYSVCEPDGTRSERYILPNATVGETLYDGIPEKNHTGGLLSDDVLLQKKSEEKLWSNLNEQPSTPTQVAENGTYGGTILPTEGSLKQQNLFAETPEEEARLLSAKSRVKHQLIGQLFDTYWLIQFEDKLFIMDQHAAHEKVLYERTMKSLANREYTSQQISPPIIVSLTAREQEVLEQHLKQFTELGFEIEHFGGMEYALRAVPDNLFGLQDKGLFLDLLDSLSEESGVSAGRAVHEKVASMSCKAAVKGRMSLSFAEANELIDELLTLENPYACPHGRPTIISMSRYELEKKFKRIV